MLAHPIQDVCLLLGEALPGTNHAATAAVRYPRATAPRPSPSGPFRPVTPILFSSNGCTGRIALRSWVITSFLSSMVPFPPQRCDTISPWPHLLSVTSRQVGAKSTAFNFVPTWHEVSSTTALNFLPTGQEVDLCSPDNSGQLVRNFCCWSPPQKCGTSCPTFPVTCFHKKVAPTWRTFLAAILQET